MARQTYTETDRQEAALALLIHGGSTKTAARHLGMPPSTLRLWRKRDDWEDTMAAIRDKYEQQLTDRFDRLVDSGQEQLADRLEHGDYVFDKQGKQVRKPMSGKDVSVTVGICFDKRQLLKSMPTNITMGADARLNGLLEKFEEAGRVMRERAQNQGNERVIEGEIVKGDNVQPLFSGADRDSH